LVSTILGTFSKSFGGYASARFFQGVFNGMFGLTAFVLANEYVGKGWVGTTGTLSNFIFPVGELILAGIAYRVPAWRAQTLVSCLTFVPCLIMPFILLPESARWLLSQGRDEEAMVMLRLVAKTNKTDFPANAILKPPTNISVQELDDEEEEDKEDAIKDEHGPDSDGGGGGIGGRGSGSRGGRSRGGRGSSGGSSGSGDQTSLKLLVTDPELRKRQLAMVVAWMTCSLLYYGLTSAGSALTDNRYADFCWQALAEFPGILLAWVGLDNRRTGRRGTMVLSFSVGGVACGLMIFLQKAPAGARTVMAMIGKTAITSAFSIVYVWPLELFPTALRSGAMGIQSFSSRVGAIIAPLVLLMGQPPSPVPYIVFTLPAILAAILTARLPETRGLPMPDSLAEITSSY